VPGHRALAGDLPRSFERAQVIGHREEVGDAVLRQDRLRQDDVSAEEDAIDGDADLIG
jgi:hypothetical protein